jgi:hypothetical protein
MNLRGIIPPVVTPMHADESLDLPRLRSHIDFMLAKGVHGIFVQCPPNQNSLFAKSPNTVSLGSPVAGRSPDGFLFCSRCSTRAR